MSDPAPPKEPLLPTPAPHASLTAPRAAESPWLLAALGAPLFSVVVYGVPGPQGSKKAVGVSKTGRVLMVESSRKVKPWRQSVLAAARVGYDQGPPLVGPLVVDMVFTLARPASFPKAAARPWDTRYDHSQHTTYPDVSKLLRSTEDALSGVVWRDDAQVIGYRRSEKLYVGANDPDVLRKPGAVIRVWRAPGSVIAARTGAPS